MAGLFVQKGHLQRARTELITSVVDPRPVLPASSGENSHCDCVSTRANAPRWVTTSVTRRPGLVTYETRSTMRWESQCVVTMTSAHSEAMSLAPPDPTKKCPEGKRVELMAPATSIW